MSETNRPVEDPVAVADRGESRSRNARGCLVAGGGLVVLLVLIELFGETGGFFTVWLVAGLRLVGGWLAFLGRVVPEVRADPAMIASFVVAAAAAALLLHVGARWLRDRVRRSGHNLIEGGPDAVGWQWRQTLALLAILFALFAASIAGAGIGHQVGWLTTRPFVRDNSKLGVTAVQSNQLRQLYLNAAIHAYEHDGAFPDRLDDLATEEQIEPKQWSDLVLLRVSRDAVPEPAVYFGAGLRPDGPADHIVLAAPRPGARGRRVVAFLNGSVDFIDETEFQSRLAAQLDTGSPADEKD